MLCAVLLAALCACCVRCALRHCYHWMCCAGLRCYRRRARVLYLSLLSCLRLAPVTACLLPASACYLPALACLLLATLYPLPAMPATHITVTHSVTTLHRSRSLTLRLSPASSLRSLLALSRSCVALAALLCGIPH
ncbi:hypothetical protein ACLPBM_20015 [Escherichia coli]|uniref:hypothetical protein n=1 Tax=Escherichia coli TaxID=562 RepID=UPI003D1E6D25